MVEAGKWVSYQSIIVKTVYLLHTKNVHNKFELGIFRLIVAMVTKEKLRFV